MPGFWVVPAGESTTDVASVRAGSVALTVGGSAVVAAVAIWVSAVAVFSTPPRGVLVGNITVGKVIVGVPSFAPHAAVKSMRISAAHK